MIKVILIVTQDCNLRCNYCDVTKRSVSMSKKVAIKATFLAFELAKRKKEKEILIRFFGGEPLLQWRLIKDVVSFAAKESLKKKIKIKFDLTTNGLLLDDIKVEFFKKHPELELIISLDGDFKSQRLNRNFNGKIDSYANIIKFKSRLVNLKNVTINMVIAPNQVNEFYNNFMHICKLGFKRFNFLPAYFIYWSKEDLGVLITEFKKVFNFIYANKDIYVKNVEICNEVPFFNSGLIVDCDGDLYNSNVFLSKHFDKLTPYLKIGSIKDENNGLFDFDAGRDVMRLIKRSIDKKIFYSTLKVDKILSSFVDRLIKWKNY